ncbi:UDP-glucuronosyltransferase 2B18-like [Liolophura sinensis]|uniref:UDP-glucuronosyltransferase 2B18-like n=1 Tax=Liolophura sinensis TaxID=3198878 RepID=UPI00315821B4
MFSKWIPQNDVLGSSKTRVLVSHGGLSGVQEAMYHGVPMVIVPMFSDQPDNAIRVEAHGYGVRLDPFNLTAASIVAAVKSVISDKRMADRMRDLSQKLKFDQSYMSAREMAAFWVEDVMKYGHLYPRPANQDLSYIQSHGLDVVAVFALICFVGVMALTKLGRMIFPKIIRSSESKMKGV